MMETPFLNTLGKELLQEKVLQILEIFSRRFTNIENSQMFLVTILKKFFPDFRFNFSRRQEGSLRDLVNKNFNKIVFLWSEVVYSTFLVKV